MIDPYRWWGLGLKFSATNDNRPFGIVHILTPAFNPTRKFLGLNGLNSLAATSKLGIVTSETAEAPSDLLVEIFFGGLIYRQQKLETD